MNPSSPSGAFSLLGARWSREGLVEVGFWTGNDVFVYAVLACPEQQLLCHYMIAGEDYIYNCTQLYHYIDHLHGILQFFQSNITYIIAFTSHSSPGTWEDRASSNPWMRTSGLEHRGRAEATAGTRRPDFWSGAVSTILQPPGAVRSPRGQHPTQSCLHVTRLSELQAPFFLLDT